MHRIRSAFVVGLTASLLVGCGATTNSDKSPSGESGALGESGPSEVPQSGLTKGLVLPVEAYLVSTPEQVAWQRAQRNLWKSCMARYGFDFNPPEPRTPSVPGYNAANMQRRYGVADEAVAAEFGYHLPGGDYEPPTWEPRAGAEEAVFTGSGAELDSQQYKGEKVPKSGCRGEAKKRLDSLKNGLAGDINHNSLQHSQQDPEVRKVISDWSACMKKSGYTVTSPHDAPGIVGSLSADSPSKKEISVAVTDVRCKAETDLVQVWFATEKEYQRKMIEKKQLALDEERKSNEMVLKTAARINE